MKKDKQKIKQKLVHWIVSKDNEKIIHFIENDKDYHVNDILNNMNETALILAVRYNQELVPYLLGRGANVNIADYTNTQPLSYAIRYQVKMKNDIELLLKSGAIVDAGDDTGMTALHYACRSNMTCAEEDIKTLLEYGANVNLPSKNGMTPVMFLLANNNEKSLPLLLEYGADIYAQDNKGRKILNFLKKDSPREKRVLSIIENFLLKKDYSNQNSKKHSIL